MTDAVAVNLDMAAKLGVHRTAASRALAELVRHGIIERGPYQAEYRFSGQWLHQPGDVTE